MEAYYRESLRKYINVKKKQSINVNVQCTFFDFKLTRIVSSYLIQRKKKKFKYFIVFFFFYFYFLR